MTALDLTTAQRDRACGVLLGAAAGDALGAGYEFGSARVGADGPRMIGGGLGNFAPGEWTDDTAMTWAVADVAATGADLRTDVALDAIAQRFRLWYETGPADIGNQTRVILGDVGAEPTGATMLATSYDLHARTGHTAGNGSLMRTSPVALAHLDDPEALVDAAMKVSALTHYDKDAQHACALWCLAIRRAVLAGEFDVRAGLRFLPESARDGWATRIDEAESRPASSFNPNGWVVTAFQAAWAAIVQTPAGGCDHFGAALDAAIRIGDDTDTVASIAGALLGARWGMSAIPAELRRPLHGYPGVNGRELERLAYLAARGGQAGKYGWPLVEHIDYSWMGCGDTFVEHPYDDGVLLADATALDALPADVDAVVSLCLTGRAQVPAGVEHINFRLMDVADPAENPNLDFALLDAARTVAALRAEGNKVVLHCVAAQSRTPTVAIAYALLLGVPLGTAVPAVCESLPAAQPNSGFRAALERIAKNQDA